MNGVRNLMMMRGKNGKTLPEHLTTVLPRGSTLLVTGHGVGGRVALAFARWIAAWLPGVSITACVADRGWIRQPAALLPLRG
jgi:hypothetical protein